MRLITFKILTIVFLFSNTVKIYSQSLTWLDTLGGEVSTAYAVSDSGNIVVGKSDNFQDDSRAFIWTPSNGIQSLTNLQNTKSWARYVSPDGNAVIGTAYIANGINYQAIKWTNDGVIIYLGTLGGSGSLNNGEGYASTPDGLTVVGTAASSNNTRHAFKWTASTGMEDLGTFNNVSNYLSIATSISDDGSIIVGHSEYGSSGTRPCYWSNGSNNELFTYLPTSIESGKATSVSPDGNYISGWIEDSTTFNDKHAYLWTGNPTFIGTDIGLLPGVAFDQGTSEAFDVNDNREVVGTATDTVYEDNAFYWYEGVIQNLNSTYAGIIPFGSKLITANGISNNGRYIVGQGLNSNTNRTEAFLLDRGSATNVNSEVYTLNVYSLEQNYPNPFNPTTTISFSLPKEEFVSLKIFNSLGEEVTDLVNETKAAGNYNITFNAAGLVSGVYLYKIQAGSFIQTKKMTLLK